MGRNLTRSLLWWSWNQTWGLHNIYSSIKWCSWEKELDIDHSCKNNARWIQHPEALWAEAINTACYASNRLFLQKFLGKTPYELLNGKKPDVSFFRVFGCKCYIYNKRQHLGKFQRHCDIVFLLVTHQSPKHIEYLIMPPAWLNKHMMWNLMN